MNSTNGSSYGKPGITDMPIMSLIFQVGYAYILPGVSMVSMVFNMISLRVFFSRPLNKKMYRYFKAKTISDLILTTIGSLSLVASCSACGLNHQLVVVWFKRLFLNFIVIGVFNFSGFMEVVIIYDRYLLLAMNSIQGSCIRKKLPFRITIITLVVASLISVIPNLLAYDVAPIVGKNNSFTLTANWFGKSPAYTTIIGVQVLTVSLVTYVPLVVFSVLFMFEFNSYIKRKNSTDTNASSVKLNNKQTSLTRMMVILIGTYIFNRTFVAFACLTVQILTFYNFSLAVFSLLNFASLTWYYFSSTLNFFIYLKFNTYFNASFKYLTKLDTSKR